MKSGFAGFGGLLLGLLIAIVSSLIVVGSFILSLIEGGRLLAFVPSPTPAPVSLLTPLPALPTHRQPSPTFTETSTPSQTPAPTLTASVTPTPCLPNPEWIQITVQAGDSLKDFGEVFNLTKQVLLDANCMEGDLPPVGSAFYVPAALETIPPTQCTRPPGWITYIVRHGDTLSSLARATGSFVTTLKTANCLISDSIFAGKSLWLPAYPYYTPVPTNPPPPTSPPPTSPPPTNLPPTDPPTPEPTSGNISNETQTP